MGKKDKIIEYGIYGPVHYTLAGDANPVALSPMKTPFPLAL